MTATVEPRDAPSPAVAPPPGNPRFALFDSLRGIAVLAVLVFHVTSITGEINRPTIGDLFAVLGNQGLTIFFVISGFLLYRPYVAAHAAGRGRPNTWRYARRRTLRIVPAYWTALTTLAIFPGIVGVFSGDWWRYYLFFQAYSNRTLGGGIPSAWSLAVEVSFYLLLPVWAVLVRALTGARQHWLRVELALLAAVAVLGIAIQVAASRLLVSSLLATTLLGECTWFALGMSLAVASVAVSDRPTPRPAALVARHPGPCWLLAIACLIGVAAVLHPGGVFNIIASLRTRQPYGRTVGAIALTAGLSFFLIAPAVFGEHAGGLPRRILAWRPLAGLGLVSYGVYLYHLTFAELIGEKSDPGHFSAAGLGLVSSEHALTTLVLLLLTLAASVIAATLSYRFVELPFLRRKEG